MVQPHATVHLIYDLKRKREEPHAEAAKAMGMEGYSIYHIPIQSLATYDTNNEIIIIFLS